MSKYIKNKHSSSQIKSKQSGFTLIEIMVSALILSVGVLGVASLQVVGLKGTQQSYTKQQAMSVVQNLTERMRSNTQGFLAGNYLIGTIDNRACGNLQACIGTGANCTDQQLADKDLDDLICGYEATGGVRTGGIMSVDGAVNTFVNGDLSILCAGSTANTCDAGNVTITLQWSERAIGQETANIPDSLIFNTNIAQ